MWCVREDEMFGLFSGESDTCKDRRKYWQRSGKQTGKVHREKS